MKTLKLATLTSISALILTFAASAQAGGKNFQSAKYRADTNTQTVNPVTYKQRSFSKNRISIASNSSLVAVKPVKLGTNTKRGLRHHIETETFGMR
ncbi:Uncharacterised protein [BD1-7 clade bacterium]|uniref:Uncharacterized protein n=1 Tax=BD1-7 clade bacterium TaxID=2029982 RepID=A0A5S9R043_9GAMM|nr:Uncharacterised protein [BD1-7 clade bacterium]